MSDKLRATIQAQLKEARRERDFWEHEAADLQDALYAIEHPDNEVAQNDAAHILEEIERQISEREAQS